MRNIVFNNESWSASNRSNRELLEDYLVELKSKRRRESTIRQYSSDGKMILCYIQAEMDNKNILEFTKKDFRSIALWLTHNRQVSNARFNRVFSLIHGMMEYAEDEEDYAYEKNLARKIKGLPKEPVREIVFLTDEQIHKLRAHLLEYHMYRECAYMDISYDSVGRIGEVSQISKEGILDRRYTNVVVGKRGKKFKLIYHNNSLESIKLYLEQRGDDNVDGLWIRGKGEYRASVKKSALYEWSKKLSRILSKIEEKEINFSPHSFRHSGLENYKNGTHYMCTYLGKEKGFTIEELQVLAHHESMDTTKSYLKPNDNNILESMFSIKLD